jgi:transposase
MLHRPMKAAPDLFLKAIAPSREGLVVAVECLFTWDWLADRCAQEGMPLVLGPALSMHALHGGKATNDTSASPKLAVLLRGGRLPQASVSPAPMRAPRDLLRRRTHLMRTRAARLAPVHHTTSQYNGPERGQKIASKAHRAGVAERCADPAVPKSIAVDVALLTSYDQRLGDGERARVKAAKHQAANPLSLGQTVPGIGKLRSLVRLYDRHDLARFPTVQDVVASCRLVTCAKASAGTRWGTSGKTIGNTHLKWAFSEAAAVCLRHHPAGQNYLARLEKKTRQGDSLAHRGSQARTGRL